MREPDFVSRRRAAWLRASGAGVGALVFCLLVNITIAWWAGPASRRADTQGLDAWLAAFNTTGRSRVVDCATSPTPGTTPCPSAAWDGFLLVERSGLNTFWAESSGPTVVWIDGQRVVGADGQRTSRLRRGEAMLSRGAHPIRISYTPDEGGPFLRMAWSAPGGTVQHLNRSASGIRSSQPSWLELQRWLWGERAPRLTAFVLALAALLLTVLVVPVGVLAAIWRRCRYPLPRSLLLVLLPSAVLLLWGLDWGLAGDWAWAPDELWPVKNVLDGLREGFSAGWHHRYPPLQFYLLSPLAATLPLAARLVALPAPSDDMVTIVYAAMRLVSVAMTLGTMIVLFWCGLEAHGRRRAAVLGPLVFILSLQVVYYGKLTNVDMPAIFWLALSLLFFLRLMRRTSTADAVWLGVTAALAVGTKDMMGGFYILMPVALIGREYAARRGAGQWTSLRAIVLQPAYLAAAGAMAIVLLLIFNPVFNLEGVRQHFSDLLFSSHLLRGSPSAREMTADQLAAASYARYPRQWGLALLGPLAWYGGWPSLLLCLAGLAIVVASRALRRVLWLLVPAASYYLSVLTPLAKPDDRYLLGIWAIAALFGGVTAASLLEGRGRKRPVGAGVFAAGVVYATLYASSINVLMTRDARTAAEQFLRREVSPFGSLGTIGLREYLPHPVGQRTTVLQPTQASLDLHAPTFLSLNVLHLTRYATHPERGPFLRDLEAGRLGYQVIFDEQPVLPWWALAREIGVLVDPVESRLTNLDKVGARIMILRRASQPGSEARVVVPSSSSGVPPRPLASNEFASRSAHARPIRRRPTRFPPLSTDARRGPGVRPGWPGRA